MYSISDTGYAPDLQTYKHTKYVTWVIVYAGLGLN